MFEDRDFDYCMNRLLERVPTGVSKAEGSVIQTALAPVAYEMESMYIELDEVLTQTFADTADYDWLKKRAAENNLVPEEATAVQVRGRFNCQIPEDSEFACGAYTYVSGDLLEEGEGYYDYRLTCTEEGTGPNGTMGALEDLEGIEEFEQGEIVEILVAGEDEEEEEVFRERYFNSFQTNAFGGNVTQYMDWVKSFDGVGGVHIYPAQGGGGTVGIEVISSQYREASAALTAQIKEEMDPTEHEGKGYGIAPIDHSLTVVSATEAEVDIETTLTLATGVSYEDIESDIENAIEEYMLGLRMAWEEEYVLNEAALVARIAALEAAMLGVQGVVDVAGTELNGQEANLNLTVHQIPVTGTITVNTGGV